MKLLARVNHFDDGAETLDANSVGVSGPPGSVLSCQPDGTLQTRDPGSRGVYETIWKRNGNFVDYAPVSGVIFTFSLINPS